MGKRRRRNPSAGERKKLAWRARLSERMAAVRGDGPGKADAVVIHPRLAPESVTDVLVYLGATLAVLLELLVLPALVYKAVGPGTRVTLAAAVAVLFAELAASALNTVRWLKLDRSGIHIGRWRGRRFIPWSDVSVINRASRGEVVMAGWLVPPVPAAEATHAVTSVGHLSIDYRGGLLYYPALEETEFLAAVRRWAPHVRLPAGEAGNPALANRR